MEDLSCTFLELLEIITQHSSATKQDKVRILEKNVQGMGCLGPS